MPADNLAPPEPPAQAFLAWLDLLASLMPETVKFEVSSWVLIVAVVGCGSVGVTRRRNE